MPFFLPAISAALAATRATASATILRGGVRRDRSKGKWAVVYQTTVGPVTSAPVETEDEARKIAEMSSPETRPQVIRLD